MPDSVRVNVEVPIELHTQLKSAAALKHKTLKEAVLTAIEQWVERNHLPPSNT